MFGKIAIITGREYITRVRKKSFLVMSILGPVFLVLLAISPVLLKKIDEGRRKVIVLGSSSLFLGVLEDTKDLDFKYEYFDLDTGIVRNLFRDSAKVSILVLPDDPYRGESPQLFSSEEPGLNTVNYISQALSNAIEKDKLRQKNIDPRVIDEVKTAVRVFSQVDGKRSNAELGFGVAMALAVLIFMAVFMYSIQVMRGVIEEKSSRVVEVIMSSVKPFQLMMGKIIGIGMVGLTQFLLWIIISFVALTIVKGKFLDEKFNPVNITEVSQTIKKAQNEKTNEKKYFASKEASQVYDNIRRVNWPLILGAFLFYFIAGYLLYSALFAGIGAVVDQEADSQQFILPVTIPIILAYVVSVSFIPQNPSGTVAFWFSVFPLTSPIAMMARIPFNDVKAWELALSMGLLVISFIGAVWVASKIYRTGILMYGKKPSYREIWKWLFYKS